MAGSGISGRFGKRRFGKNMAADVSAKTWRRTFRQKNMPKRLRLKKFAETSRMIYCGAYAMYARSPSPSQRAAPTTIASRSPFPLGLCSCSTSLSKMELLAAPRGRGALEEMGTYPRGSRTFRQKKIAETSRIFFAETSLPKRPAPGSGYFVKSDVAGPIMFVIKQFYCGCASCTK